MKIIKKGMVIFASIFALSLLIGAQPASSKEIYNYELEQEIKELKIYNWILWKSKPGMRHLMMAL